MIQTIHKSTQKARKIHYDDGFEMYLEKWIDEGFYLPKNRKVSFSHYRDIVNYLKKHRRSIIEKGEEYVRQFNTDGGDTWTFRMNKKMYDIAHEYNLFYND